MDVRAQTVTLARDVVSPWQRRCLSVDGLLWVQQIKDVLVSHLSSMGPLKNDVVLTAAGACAKRVTRLSQISLQILLSQHVERIHQG